MSELEVPVVQPGEAHDLPPASAAERVSVNERRVHQVVAMGGGDWAEVTARAAAEGQDDVMIINMGPQHPSTHGVLRLVVELKGEEVINLQPVVGYLHTGIEKSAEFRTWVQGVTFVTRMDYLAPIFNETAYCLAVEKLLGIEPPPRATALRVLMMELNRISSHLVWLATTGLELGALSIMLYGFREREEILDILEDVTGLRMNHAWVRPAGVSQDLPDGTEDKIRAFVRDMRAKADEYETLLTNNPIWLERTKGIGVIAAEEAIALGLSGPTLRGSGVKHDIRKDEPYAAYGEMDFEVPVGKAGDTYDRYLVRIEEFRQSVRIIRQAIEGLPEGPIVGKVPRLIKPPAGETYHAIESPKGELGYFIVSDGKSVTPYRFRVRPPSFCNLQGLPRLVKGHLVADVVALIGSIDIVLGEVDR